MYRVYDNEKKCWVKEDIFLSPIEDVIIFVNNLFGRKKPSLVPSSRYVYQRDIELLDKDDVLMYEGDIVQGDTTDIHFIGIITYLPQLASYVVLDYHTGKYYSLGEKQRKLIKIIGNIFDNRDMLPSEYSEDNVQ